MLLYLLLSFQVLFTSTTIPNLNTHPNIMEENTTESHLSDGNDLRAMMHRYTAYNLWANQQLAQWLIQASEEDLDREIESSYSSVKETIFHIWSAEYAWLHTIQGEKADASPTKSFEGNKNELMEGWLLASQNFSNHVQTMTTEDLTTQSPRSNGKGHTLIADMIQHCMNHSTYHRRQLITLGRQLGLMDAPRTDFIYYVGLGE